MTLTRRDLDEVAGELEALVTPEAADLRLPRYNVAPTDRHPIIRLVGEERRIEPATWGLLRTGGGLHINARAESAPFRDAFREAFAVRRCVIPADGFFEWGGPPEARRPFWIHRPDGKLLLMAGLYEDSGPERRFTVLTTSPNPTVAAIHDRMPAILSSSSEARGWLLDGGQRYLQPAPEDALVATPVSRRVNAVENDDPRCLEAERGEQLRLF